MRPDEEDITAKVVRDDGQIAELTSLLKCAGLTADERLILQEGCLMNYYAAGYGKDSLSFIHGASAPTPGTFCSAKSNQKQHGGTLSMGSPHDPSRDDQRGRLDPPHRNRQAPQLLRQTAQVCREAHDDRLPLADRRLYGRQRSIVKPP